MADNSAQWPCDFQAANTIKLTVGTSSSTTGSGTGGIGGPVSSRVRVAAAQFEPSQIQDLGDVIPALMEIKAKAQVPMTFHVRLEVGDGVSIPSGGVLDEINSLLSDFDPGFRVGSEQA